MYGGELNHCFGLVDRFTYSATPGPSLNTGENHLILSTQNLSTVQLHIGIFFIFLSGWRGGGVGLKEQFSSFLSGSFSVSLHVRRAANLDRSSMIFLTVQ